MDKLRFTPHAVAKMIFLRDIGNTEVSFYAQSDPDDLGKIIDLNMVPQKCNSCYTEFDDNGVANFFDRMVDANHAIETFARVWCHTHPGTSATPSQRDHQTFKDAFGNNHWAVMFILGTTGEYTCKQRIKCNAVSDRFQLEDIIREIPVIALIPVAGMDIVLEMDLEKAIKAVDWKLAPSEETKALWKAEYDLNWSAMSYSSGTSNWDNRSFGHYGQSTQGSNYNPPERKSRVYGAGWRVNHHGNWTKSELQERIDEKNGITISPDYNTPKDPYYIAPTGTLNKPRQQLTKRERKYIKKHGSLAGFVSPTNTGVKGTLLVKVEKLETQGLTQQSDDGFEWMDEAIAQAKEKEAHPDIKLNNYTVKLDDMDYIPAQYRGKRIKNVWASGPLEAVNIVHAKIGAPPFRGKLTADGKDIFVPGEEDIEDGDDTELSDEEACELMEKELDECWKLHDKGEITLSDMRDMEEEILARYDTKIDEMYDLAVKTAIAKDRVHEDDGDEELLLVPEDDEDLATNEGLANFARHGDDFGHGIADSDTHILGFRSDI